MENLPKVRMPIDPGNRLFINAFTSCLQANVRVEARCISIWTYSRQLVEVIFSRPLRDSWDRGQLPL